jgi:hypothetical protein
VLVGAKDEVKWNESMGERGGGRGPPKNATDDVNNII